MLRRRSMMFILLLCVAILGAACTQPSAAPAPAAQPTTAPAPAAQPAAPEATAAPAAAQPAEKVELVFRQGDPPGEIDGLVKAVDLWNANNPNIHVTLETVPWADGQAQYVREAQAGGGPDVMQEAFVWTANLGKANLVQDLTSLINQEPPGKGIADFVGVDLGTVNGKIYGVPWTIDTAAMVYRPDLLQAGGVTAFPETWDDLKAVAKKLTIDKDGDGKTDQYGFCWPAGGAPDGATWFLVNAYLWSNGQTFMKPGADGKGTVAISEAELAAAMDYFNSFFTEKLTPESMIGISWEGDPEMVGSLDRGDCAMSNFRIGTFVQAVQQAKNPLAMALEPKGSSGRASHLGGRALGINVNTKHTKEAWAFLNFMVTQETFSTYAQYPAQKALLDEKQKTLPELQKPYAEQLKYGKTFADYIFSGANVNSMWAATTKEFSAVFAGQKPSNQAAADLIKTFNDLLAAVK